MADNKAVEFDAIVVGSGISGGWAVKEFTEKGMKTLLIERGRHVEHMEDYVTEGLAPWELRLRDEVDHDIENTEYPIQSQCFAFKETSKHFFANDKDHPYSQEKDKPFNWYRGEQLGGKSLLWGRQCYRLSDLDFEANKKDGHGVDWPIRYKDIDKWYGYVEKFVGISGSKEGLSQLPDGEFLPPMEMSCVERMMSRKFEEIYQDRRMIIGRCANLTEPQPVHLDLGRGTCQARNECHRGCSFGGYFSSQAATLPAANRTGNLTTVTNSIAHSLVYDANTNKAIGVRIIDAHTNERRIYSAKVIFLCASTLGTTQILLNSTSDTFQNGFANSSGTIGHYLMDHVSGAGASGIVPGYLDRYHKGRRSNGIYIPRFKNLNGQSENYVRGFGYQGWSARLGWQAGMDKPGFGAEFKKSFKTPGPWEFSVGSAGEMLPCYDNAVTLHKTKVDKWGIPQIHINCSYGENERLMQKDMMVQAVKMLKDMELQNVKGSLDENSIPGTVIHEMGTARMGHDPKTSVLNGFNQCHDVDNVFITDGSAMTSSACQNPSLTYMALTARAVDYATTQMKSGAL